MILLPFSTLMAQNTGTEPRENTKLEITIKENKDADVYIDGKKYDHAIIDLLDKEKIESISVLKDEQALKRFNAPNGVILIKSKLNREGQVKIRSNSANVDGGDPLVIIDGKVVGQGQEALSKLSPDDIQSVNVLKGENALKSIYGSAVKEANKKNGSAVSGVIIVTTKEAAKLEK